jgi:hypothetical protein
MSAFIVSREHIRALVQAALMGPTELAIGTYWPILRFDGKDMNPEGLGKALARENRISVDYRYPQHANGETDQPFSLGFPRRRSAVEILKLIACYEYQACEHPGWEDSPVRQFCRDLEAAIITELPGYDEAPWTID